MREKPQKRWVHKSEYLRLVRRRVFYCASGIVGVSFYIAFNCLVNYSPTTPTQPVVENTPFHPGPFGWFFIVIGVMLALAVLLAEFCQVFGECFKAAWEVESVHLITSRNHHLAPPLGRAILAPTDGTSPRRRGW